MAERQLPRLSLAEVNQALMESEHKLTLEQGLAGRPWFKHLVDAPGQYTGYEAKTLPVVREAIEQKQWKEAEAGICGHGAGSAKRKPRKFFPSRKSWTQRSSLILRESSRG